MTQIEDMLRTALTTAPQPATTTPDPLSDLDRRIGRARLRLGSVAIVGVIALVAAIVVPLSLIGSNGSGRVAPAHEGNVPIQSWPTGGTVQAAGAGGGAAWAIIGQTVPAKSGGKPGVRFVAEQRDPASGKVLSFDPLTTPIDGLAYGAGQMWGWGGGGGDKHFPDTKIAIFKPGGGLAYGLNLGPHHDIGSIGFVGNSVYAVGDKGTVYGPSVNALTTAFTQVEQVPGAIDAIGGHGTIYFLGQHKIVAQFAASAGWPAAIPGEPIKIRGLPLVSTPAGFWVVRGRNLVQVDVQGRQIGATIVVPKTGNPMFAALSTPFEAVVDNAGGLYVAMSNDTNPTLENLLYYSPAALHSADPKPTAFHTGSEQLRSIALDPAGGIVCFGTSEFGRWNPAG